MRRGKAILLPKAITDIVDQVPSLVSSILTHWGKRCLPCSFFFFLRTTDVFILSHLPSCCWSPPLETSGLIGSKMFVSKQLGGARGRGWWVDQRLVLWPDRVVERDCVKAAAKSPKYKFLNGNKRHRPLRPKRSEAIYSLLLKAWWYITYLLALYCWIIWVLWQL